MIYLVYEDQVALEIVEEKSFSYDLHAKIVVQVELFLKSRRPAIKRMHHESYFACLRSRVVTSTLQSS